MYAIKYIQRCTVFRILRFSPSSPFRVPPFRANARRAVLAFTVSEPSKTYVFRASFSITKCDRLSYSKLPAWQEWGETKFSLQIWNVEKERRIVRVCRAWTWETFDTEVRNTNVSNDAVSFAGGRCYSRLFQHRVVRERFVGGGGGKLRNCRKFEGPRRCPPSPVFGKWNQFSTLRELADVRACRSIGLNSNSQLDIVAKENEFVSRAFIFSPLSVSLGVFWPVNGAHAKAASMFTIPSQSGEKVATETASWAYLQSTICLSTFREGKRLRFIPSSATQLLLNLLFA